MFLQTSFWVDRHKKNKKKLGNKFKLFPFLTFSQQPNRYKDDKIYKREREKPIYQETTKSGLDPDRGPFLPHNTGEELDPSEAATL